MANIFVQWMLITVITAVHPFFVSMTDINFNSKDQQLEVSVRIFTDDFENTLRKNFSGKIDILHPDDQKMMDEYVSSYIQKHLQLVVNERKIPMAFVGYEQQGESIWTYFEVKNVVAVKKIGLINSLLHDYTDKQVNMMHVAAGENEKSYKLDFPDTNAVFNF